MNLFRYCRLLAAGLVLCLGAFSTNALAASVRFAYVPNASGSISAFTVNEDTGRLASIGSPISLASSRIVVNESRSLAYALSSSSASISTFSIDSAAGTLTQVGNPVPVTVGYSDGTHSSFVSDFLALDPNGKFLFVGKWSSSSYGGSSSIDSFRIDSVSGIPSYVSTTTITNYSYCCQGFAFDPTGSFLYLTHSNYGLMHVLSIDPLSGATTVVQHVGNPTGVTSAAFDIAMHPSGNYAYTTNPRNCSRCGATPAGQVGVYSVSSITGQLTPVGGVEVGLDPQGIAIDPTGKFVLIADATTNQVFVFSIDQSTGLLTQVGAPISTGTSPQDVRIDSTGRFVYVTNSGSNNVYLYSLDSTSGLLTLVQAQSALGTGPIMLDEYSNGAPIKVAAAAGNAQATVSFFAPSNKRGSAITGYTVTSIPAGGVDTNAGTTALTHTITGLINGTSYTFIVTPTNAAGDGPSSNVSNTIILTNQFISFGPAPTIITGSIGTVTATTTSGLPVTYSSLTTSICSASGSTVTGIAAGTCTIAANQAGNTSYSAASQVTQNITIGAASAASQTISFGTAPTITIGGTGTVSATTTSGLSIIFDSLSPSVCAVNGSTVTSVTAGTCIIAADQAGNTSYSAATQATQNITVAASQASTVTCTAEYAPVCGADGLTYSNSCNAGVAGVTVASQGACSTAASGSDINVTGVVRLRPQVLMAGFDPILIDLADTSFKLFCVVRPGAVAIQDVRTANNSGGFSVAMNHAGTYSDGDQRYETTYAFTRGAFPDNSVLGDLFGSASSQFRMSVVDLTQQTHSFPHLEFGNNVLLPTPITSPNVTISTTAGTRRSIPQVLAAGFDPMLIDLGDTSFDAVAIVRAGAVPVSSVSISQNQGGFSMAMNRVATLPNGDEKYKITYTYQRGAFPATSMADLFGTQPNQFNFVVTDQAQQTHRFPELRFGNLPAM